MRRLVQAGIMIAAGAAIMMMALVFVPIGQPERLSVTTGDPVRGLVLARAAGCIGCHSKPGAGGVTLAGGAPLVTPFGTFHPPNITPHPTAGIGGWTIEQFATAMRHGVSPDGRPYYPAFPYAFYTRLTDQDIADIWAALRSVPPDATVSAAQALPWPYAFRSGLKLWRALYFEPGRMPMDARLSPEAQRGAYLVEAVLHCGACHTPRNAFGALDEARHFQGAGGLPGGARAPRIDAAHLRAEGWTATDMVETLKTGLLISGDSVGGLMGEFVQTSTSHLTDADLRAVGAFLLHRGE